MTNGWVTLTTVVTQTFWYTGCRYLNRGNKTANINVKNCSLSTSYIREMTSKTAKIMNGGITLEAR